MPVINHAQRAFHAWPILVRVAKQADPTITYGKIAEELGLHHRAVRYVLSEIQDYCLAEKKPPMTILVVNAKDHLPGDGFIAWDVDDFDRGIAEVVAYPWEQMANPFAYAAGGLTEEELAEKLVETPSSAGEVYALVKVRGAAQSIFRKALLRAYDYQCAICGLSFEEALQAAHLIPWSAATPEQRMSPKNGLLLCSTHHGLFDAGRITISPSYTVTYDDPKGVDGAYTDTDREVSIKRHGTAAFMPKSEKHRPDPAALNHHHEAWEWTF